MPKAFTAESPPAKGQKSSTRSPRGSSSNGCAAFSVITMDQLMCASLFPHPLLIQWTCAMQKVQHRRLVTVSETKRTDTPAHIEEPQPLRTTLSLSLSLFNSNIVSFVYVLFVVPAWRLTEVYSITVGLYLIMYYVVSCFVWCPCMAIDVSVQHHKGFLSDVILFTQCYCHWGTRLYAMKTLLSLQPTIQPKRPGIPFS